MHFWSSILCQTPTNLYNIGTCIRCRRYSIYKKRQFFCRKLCVRVFFKVSFMSSLHISPATFTSVNTFKFDENPRPFKKFTQNSSLKIIFCINHQDNSFPKKTHKQIRTCLSCTEHQHMLIENTIVTSSKLSKH